jgi:hypothetical protein
MRALGTVLRWVDRAWRRSPNLSADGLTERKWHRFADVAQGPMTDSPNRKSERTTAVTFHYIKSQNFGVMHVDGIVGTITPQGLIHMAVFAERAAIPQTAVHEIDAKGTLSALPVETTSKPGIVREMSADLIFSPIVARAIANWLGDKLKEYDTLTKPGGTA